MSTRKKIIIISAIVLTIGLVGYFVIYPKFKTPAPPAAPAAATAASARAWIATWRSKFSDDANWNRAIAALTDDDATKLQYVLSYTGGNIFTDNPAMGAWYQTFLSSNHLS